MIRVIKKFNRILSAHQKRMIAILTVLMLVGGIFEMLGVAMVVPLASAILSENLMNNIYVKMIADLLHVTSRKQFVLLMIVALIVLFIVKNAFLMFQNYFQLRFVCNNRYVLQNKMMQLLLHRNYEFYLYHTTSEINTLMDNDIPMTFSLLTNMLSLFTELTVSAFLIIAMLVASPVLAIGVGAVMLLVVLIVQKAVKPALKKASEITVEGLQKSKKWMLQAIGGIKEVKVAGKEEFFRERYSDNRLMSLNAEKTRDMISAFPRMLIEVIGVCGMLGVIAVMILLDKDITQLWVQMAAFAVAAIRLLPSANRISTYINMMTYYEPMLDSVLENTDLLRQAEEMHKQGIIDNEIPTGKINTFTEAIVLKDVCYHYPNVDKDVLHEAYMEIKIGQSVGVKGRSGAGKTTAIDILMGLLKPQNGCVMVDGLDIREDMGGWHKLISYVPQTIYLIEDSIRANVAFGVPESEIDDNEVWRALREAQLDDFVRSLPGGLDNNIGERGVRISGGQRQRLGIARALYTNPQVLVFDEATAALDQETERAIIESINALHGKKTMIIIAHRLTTIEDCDVIYQVENGKIMETTL